MRISPILLAGLSLGVGACALRAPDRGEVLEGTPAVAKARFEVRARHTDGVGVTVVFPSDAEGRAVKPAGSLPALVFVQGGFVSTARYEWLAASLAQRGYVVALPEHPLDLAFFAVDNGAAARDLLVSPPEGSLLEGVVDPDRTAVAGHSLGGVVAVKLALSQPFRALAMLASFPDSADDAAVAGYGKPVLSLAGENDCSADLSDVAAGIARFPQPKVFAVVDGATHYQFTDSDKEDVEGGCASGVSLDDAHARIAGALGTFLDAALTDGSTGAAGIDAIDGVELRDAGSAGGEP